MKQQMLWMAAAVLATGFLLEAGPASAQGKSRRPFPGRSKGQRGGFQDRLKVGDDAPDFSLKTLDGKSTVKLSSFEGKKPVVLIFGSYT